MRLEGDAGFREGSYHAVYLAGGAIAEELPTVIGQVQRWNEVSSSTLPTEDASRCLHRFDYGPEITSEILPEVLHWVATAINKVLYHLLGCVREETLDDWLFVTDAHVLQDFGYAVLIQGRGYFVDPQVRNRRVF